MDKHQDIWGEKYEKVLRGEGAPAGERWLDAWLHLAPTGAHRRALEVGCGHGHSTRLLLDRGFAVTAIDFSERALELCRRLAPEARVKRVDFREGLPFDGDRFEVIVADQSLHFFTWDMTTAIVSDIAERLVVGGLFAGRFNSTGDARVVAGAGEPVQGQSNLFLVDGLEKRFFTRECFSKLFGPPWRKVALTEKIICRHGRRKMIWELIARTLGRDCAEHDTAQDRESDDVPFTHVS